MAERTAARRWFGPVVLAGLASSVLGAVAGAKPWAGDPGVVGDPLGTLGSAGEVPLGLALALVVLACWGVLLAVRGRARRLVAGLAAVASVVLVGVAVHAAFTVPGKVVAAARASALTRTSGVGLTGWFWVALVCAVVSVLATLAAVRFAPGWPSRGSRYDAPGAQKAPVGAAEVEEIDLWKSMDEGHDPTT